MGYVGTVQFQFSQAVTPSAGLDPMRNCSIAKRYGFGGGGILLEPAQCLSLCVVQGCLCVQVSMCVYMYVCVCVCSTGVCAGVYLNWRFS